MNADSVKARLKSEYLDTAAKLSQQKEKAGFYYYFFSESGFDDNLVKEAVNKKNIKLMDIKEIVQPSFNC